MTNESWKENTILVKFCWQDIPDVEKNVLVSWLTDKIQQVERENKKKI